MICSYNSFKKCSMCFLRHTLIQKNYDCLNIALLRKDFFSPNKSSLKLKPLTFSYKTIHQFISSNWQPPIKPPWRVAGCDWLALYVGLWLVHQLPAHFSSFDGWVTIHAGDLCAVSLHNPGGNIRRNKLKNNEYFS